MKLSKQDILHLADLAKLDLSEMEIETYRSQLAEVLAYFDRVKKLNLDNIKESLSGVDSETSVWRQDQPVSGDGGALASAHKIVDDYMVAPPVFKR